jgi:hypothetical protein
MAGSLMTVAKEISKYKLDLVGIRMSDGTGINTELAAGMYTFLWKGERESRIIYKFMYRIMISAVKSVEFVKKKGCHR